MTIRAMIIVVPLLILFGPALPGSQTVRDKTADDLLTVAEKYNYRAAAKSATVVKLIDRIASRGKHVHRFSFGKTVEGKPLVGAVVARPAVTQPDDLKNDKRLVVLIIGNIHSGECCGQEALLKMMRELLLQPKHPWLDNLVLLIVPNYNADGNDKRSLDNRPGQVGPADGMGRRANAQGFDLNRDYVKLESPEARALIALMNKWNPHCFIDCHTTNGSWHRYQLTYDVQHNPAADPRIASLMREKMMPAVTRNLLKKKIDTFYYGNFDRKMKGWYTYGHQPRYALHYFALRGRIGILSEAYAYVTFRERIEATHAFVGECLTFLNNNAREIQARLDAAEKATTNAGRKPRADDLVPIRSEMAKIGKDPIKIKGYDPPWQPALKREKLVPGVRPAPPGRPKDYAVDFYGGFEPVKSVRRPYAYVLPAKLNKVAEKLRQHGITIERLSKEVEVPLEVYRWKEFTKSKRPFQKHQLAKATVTAKRENRRLPAGTLVVRTGQPLGTLLVYLLEPESDDGLLTWNYFDDYFQKGGEFPVYRLLSRMNLPVQVLKAMP